MRKLAVLVVVACVTGCADLAEPAPLAPPPLAPAAESASGDEVLGPGEESGGGPGADGPSDADVAASWMPTLGEVCVVACASMTAMGCSAMGDVCEAAEVVTVGGATVPCLVALAVACASTLSCLLIC